MTATLADPVDSTEPTAGDDSARSEAREWAHLALVLAARMYRVWLLGLAAIALAPMLFGWGSYVIKTGSMEPSIAVGDVVVGKPYTDDQRVRVGRVFVFDDPATTKERLLVHRIVELRDDGDYTTAGDANSVTDATALPRTNIEATGVLLAPYIGLPVTWAQSGQWVRFALWMLLTMAAFALASRNLEGEPPKWGLLRLIRDAISRRTDDPDDDPDDDRGDPDTTGNTTNDTTGGSKGEASTTRNQVLRSAAPVVAASLLALFGTVTATANAGFTAQTRNSAMSWTVGEWAQPYIKAVLTDSPSAFWLLDESAGTNTAQDRSGNTVLGTYRAGASLGQPGALTASNPGTSMRATGSGLAFTSANPVASPASHTVEFWFRTTSTTGGYLMGFGSSTAATSPTADRIVRMDTAGRLTYGDWVTNPSRIITTPRAYNDGAWHHVVVASTFSNFSETTVYVDGVAVVAGTTSKTTPHTGYWRLGGGSGSPAFNGSIDNVAVYNSVLTAQRVAAHYAAR